MQSPRLRLRVTAAAETVLRAGHPWVFADSIRGQNRPGECGELGVIYDRRDRFLAIGLYDPESPIRVRVLHAGKPATLDAAWWSARLAQAVERRRGLFDERTTGHRWINGESDGWPGLVLDRYDATLVLKLYTAAWLPRLGKLSALVWAQLKPERIILRVSRNVGRLLDPGSTSNARPRRRARAAASMDPTSGSLPAPAAADRPRDGEVLLGPPPEGPVTFLETGLRFEADVLRGQKTGFFLDQRDNRRNVESLAGGRRVLNAFSFSGGFSLYAARGEAQLCPEWLEPCHRTLRARMRTSGRIGLAARRPAAPIRFDRSRPAVVCEAGSRTPGGDPRLRKTGGAGDPAPGARGDPRRLLVLGSCHRGGVFRGRAPERSGVQTPFRRDADHQPCAGSSSNVPRGGLFEGDLLEALTEAQKRCWTAMPSTLRGPSSSSPSVALSSFCRLSLAFR
jgi:hypothetical protein